MNTNSPITVIAKNLKMANEGLTLMIGELENGGNPVDVARKLKKLELAISSAKTELIRQQHLIDGFGMWAAE